MSLFSEKNERLISYLLVLFGAVIYVSLIFNNNVWLDEAFTATLVRTDMAGVLERSMNDTLPPLYNIILKIMTDIFGYKVPVMKLTSVIPMILTMVVSATTVRKRHGFLVSSIFTVCLFTMPNLLFYGVEIRMYSLGFFFATASAVYAYECICEDNDGICNKIYIETLGKNNDSDDEDQKLQNKNLTENSNNDDGNRSISIKQDKAADTSTAAKSNVKKSINNWVIFIIVSALAGYSHHFAFVAVGFVYLMLLLYYMVFDRKHIKRFFYCLIATFILYLPCLLVTLKQIKSVSGYFSMPDVTLPVFIKYAIYPYITGNKVVSILLALCVAGLVAADIYFIVSLINNKKKTSNLGIINNLGISNNREEANNQEITNNWKITNNQGTTNNRETTKTIDKDCLAVIYALSLFISYYGVLVFGTIVSKIMTANIFVDRYLLFAHGFIWLFFAISVGNICDYLPAEINTSGKNTTKINASILNTSVVNTARTNAAGGSVKNKIPGKRLIIFTFILITCAGISGYIKQFNLEYSNSPDELIAFLKDNVKDGDVLYIIEDNEELAYCLPFYDNRLINYEDINKTAEAADINRGSIWIAVYSDSDEQDELSAFGDLGYEAEYAGEFSFDRYYFYMYKLSKNW